MIRVCHPFGNPNSYNTALSFLEVGQLKRFHTSIYQPFGMAKRSHPSLPRSYVTTHPTREVIRLGAAFLPLGRWNGRRKQLVDWVTYSFDANTARSVVKSDGAVYCYEDSAQATFKLASQLGAMRIYELPILHFREMQAIFKTEIEKEPGLASFFQTLHDPSSKLERKDREVMDADVIVVPAKFVQRSVERFLKPKGRFVVVPYGSDVDVTPKLWTSTDREGPMRLFFAGILGPRKGIHVLFEALANLSTRHFHLTLAGRWEPGFRNWLSRRYSIEYEWLGQLTHAEVYEAYRRAHVLVFPSLAEGFGLVILEAMASGIPVITTDQTAGPDIIEDGLDGWITPAGQVEALRACFEQALERGRLPEMGQAARRKALTLSWKSYREKLRTSVFDALEISVQR
jgi:glycosyltransferase involved in cell wall biosynthesis